MQNMWPYDDLIVDERAKGYSEAYFKETYKNFFDDFYRDYNASDEEALETHQNMIDYYKRIVPLEIKEKVADIRILALNRATAEVKTLLNDRARKNRAKHDELTLAYMDYSKENTSPRLEALNPLLNLHDGDIKAVESDGKDLIMTVDHIGFNCDAIIRFTNYDFIESSDFSNLQWLYYEIYDEDDKMELHVLCCRQLLDDWELASFCIGADDISVVLGAENE